MHRITAWVQKANIKITIHQLSYLAVSLASDF